MKKSLTISSIFVFGVLLFSNFAEKPMKNFVFSMVSEEPVLPDEPFDYSDLIIPEHLTAAAEEPTGYEPKGIDPNALQFIEDDIATLGRVLFYDEKLSALENISCGSCHAQSLSFTENKPFSEGIDSQTKRNSMQLNDIGWSNNETFFWDMSESDLHTMIRLPLTDDNEIGANMDDINYKLSQTTYYPDLFTKAFGTSLVTEDRIVESLVHFISSMNTFNSEFDQQIENNFQGFTDEELLGLELFASNCGTCHTQGKHDPFQFGGFFGGFPLDFFPEIFNNGLPVDADDAGAGEWNSEYKDLFKIPNLRNVEMTAPYMHDGRFNTLEEVVEHYSEGVVGNQWTNSLSVDQGGLPDGGLNMKPEEKSALVAFMKTFTDVSFITDEKWADPFGNDDNTVSNQTLQFDDLLIKPNPMADRAVIQYSNAQGQLVSVNIYNPSGQLMRHFNTNDSRFTLDKNDFNSGMYMIEMIMGDRRSTTRLMVR